MGLEKRLHDATKLQMEQSVLNLEKLQERWERHPSRIGENEGDVHALRESINQLQNALQRKNKVMARLDDQIYSDRRRLQLPSTDLPLADQVVSLENTIYFLEQEISKKAGVITELRNKQAELIIL